jgi:hypothetical protein
MRGLIEFKCGNCVKEEEDEEGSAKSPNTKKKNKRKESHKKKSQKSNVTCCQNQCQGWGGYSTRRGEEQRQHENFNWKKEKGKQKNRHTLEKNRRKASMQSSCHGVAITCVWVVVSGWVVERGGKSGSCEKKANEAMQPCGREQAEAKTWGYA